MIKIRKSWKFNPSQRPHSTKKGAKGYNRKDNKRIAKESY